MLTAEEQKLIERVSGEDAASDLAEIQHSIDAGYDCWQNPETRSRHAVSDVESLMALCRKIPALLAIIERLEATCEGMIDGLDLSLAYKEFDDMALARKLRDVERENAELRESWERERRLREALAAVIDDYGATRRTQASGYDIEWESVAVARAALADGLEDQ